MSTHLVITIIADDRPGIVEQVATVISQCEGNWLESSLSRLGGKFAGILLVEIAVARQDELETALKSLESKGIRVVLELAGGDTFEAGGEELLLSVVGNDRRGIVGEISGVLARCNVNVDELYTSTENAPMSGEMLFHATAAIVLPLGLSRDALQDALEELSDDLMVELGELED